MTPRRALWGLVLVSGAIRLAAAASLGPGNDEAYYYLFTVHRDWSFYDHPPMLAVVEELGLGLGGGVVSALTLRLGFIALFAGSTLLMARLASRFYGPWAGFFAALVLNVSGYFGTAAGLFALPDGPCVFFWLLTLDASAGALARPGRILRWLWVGLAWGGAMLSKYHAIFLPAGMMLFVVVEPLARPCLRRVGPYLAVVVGIVVFSPVIAWNAAHGWASFAFQAGRAVRGLELRPAGALGMIAGQALYLFPWIWLPLVVMTWRRLTNREELQSTRIDPLREDPPEGNRRASTRFLLSQSMLPLAVFLVMACFRPTLPHWSLVGYLPLMPILGEAWAVRAAIDPRPIRRRVVFCSMIPVLLAGCAILQAQFGLFQKGSALGLVPIAHDPSVDLYGWGEVARELRRRGLVGRPDTFLFTSKWYHSGQLAFALGGEAPVLCYSPLDAHGFAFWSRPEQWVGRDGILLVVDPSSTEPAMYDRWFARIKPLGAFEVLRAGEPVRRIRMYRCVRQRVPFPFDHLRARVASRRLFGDNRTR